MTAPAAVVCRWRPSLFLLLLAVLLTDLPFRHHFRHGLVFAAPQISQRITNAIDDLFPSAPAPVGPGGGAPEAGLVPPLTQVNPTPPSPQAPPQQPPSLPGGLPKGGILPAVPVPTLPNPSIVPPTPAAPPQPVNAPKAPVNTTLPAALPPPPTTANTTLAPPGVESIAPGTVRGANVASERSAPTSGTSPADAGLGGLVTAGIIVGAVVLASMIGIFVFRKWKLRPKVKRGASQWRTASQIVSARQATPPPVMPSYTPPPHLVVSSASHEYPDAAYGVHAAPPLMRSPSASSGHHPHPHHPAYAYPPQQPPYHQSPQMIQRTVEMDLALRHHLRNG